ncbi:hypothetical protein [Enterococcus mundtii]|uniref:hypothetical protein n=1 Tax=Enterococcus TaxID=1350 RepID=UPI0018E25996|nr:hypothetical protein [Enterococcus mundtii]
MDAPKELYSDALRGARNQLKGAKRAYKIQPTLENERRVKAIRRRCSIYGKLQKGDSK